MVDAETAEVINNGRIKESPCQGTGCKSSGCQF